MWNPCVDTFCHVCLACCWLYHAKSSFANFGLVWILWFLYLQDVMVQSSLCLSEHNKHGSVAISKGKSQYVVTNGENNGWLQIWGLPKPGICQSAFLQRPSGKRQRAERELEVVLAISCFIQKQIHRVTICLSKCYAMKSIRCVVYQLGFFAFLEALNNIPS